MNHIDEKNKSLLEKYLVNGDKNAYEELMISNEKLVFYCIEKLVDIPNMSWEDKYRNFYGVCYIGLHKAINSYNLSKANDIAFSTYAVTCIHNEIRREKSFYKNDEKNTSFEELGDLILDELTPIQEVLVDTEDMIENFIDKDYDQYVLNEVDILLNKLGENTKLLLEMYYGINGEKKRTQEEIANICNMGRTYLNVLFSEFKRYIKLKIKIKDDNDDRIVASLNLLKNFEKTLTKPRVNLYREKLLQEYSKEELEKAIDKQKDDTRKFLREYFEFEESNSFNKEMINNTKGKVFIYDILNEVEKTLEKQNSNLAKGNAFNKK